MFLRLCIGYEKGFCKFMGRAIDGVVFIFTTKRNVARCIW